MLEDVTEKVEKFCCLKHHGKFCLQSMWHISYCYVTCHQREVRACQNVINSNLTMLSHTRVK